MRQERGVILISQDDIKNLTESLNDNVVKGLKHNLDEFYAKIE